MNRLFLVVVAFVFCISFAFGQDLAAKVSAAQERCDEINANLQNYNRQLFNYSAAGSKEVYTLNKELKCVHVVVIENGIEKNVYWYFNNNQLVFSSQKWKEVITDKLVDEEKFYFSNAQLISWENKQEHFPNNSDAFIQMNEKLNSYAAKLLADAKSQN